EGIGGEARGGHLFRAAGRHGAYTFNCHRGGAAGLPGERRRLALQDRIGIHVERHGGRGGGPTPPPAPPPREKKRHTTEQQSKSQKRRSANHASSPKRCDRSLGYT